MEFLPENVIKLDRELSDLDMFTLDFIKLLRKHTPYVLISGYVSILLGRARVSEDVDLIVPKMEFSKLKSLLADVSKGGFYCLNAESPESIYDYLKDGVAVRFAKIGKVIPNMEFKFAKNKFDNLALAKTLTVKVDKVELIISHLELQIAFKEVVLKSDKDLEDARHLRNIAKGHLDLALIKLYEGLLHDFH
jgi:hypothetical protein